MINVVKVTGRKKSEDSKEKILLAAIQRFSRFGYRRTSINDVAEEAGVARATVYLYWKRKQDLFVVGLERFNLHSWSLAEITAAKKGSAAERIIATLMAQYGTTSDIERCDNSFRGGSFLGSGDLGKTPRVQVKSL